MDLRIGESIDHIENIYQTLFANSLLLSFVSCQVLLHLDENRRLSGLETQPSSAVTLNQHVRSNQGPNLAFTRLCCWHAPWLWRLDGALRIKHLCELSGVILPLHSLAVEDIVSRVSVARWLFSAGYPDDFCEEGNDVADMDLLMLGWASCKVAVKDLPHWQRQYRHQHTGRTRELWHWK